MMAMSTVSTAFGYDLDQDGKNGHSAPFAWTG